MHTATRFSESVLHESMGKEVATYEPVTAAVPSIGSGSTPLATLAEAGRLSGTSAMRALPAARTEKAVEPVVADDGGGGLLLLPPQAPIAKNAVTAAPRRAHFTK